MDKLNCVSGTRVYHRVRQQYGFIMPNIYQKFCDSTSVVVRFDSGDELEITANLLNKVSEKDFYKVS